MKRKRKSINFVALLLKFFGVGIVYIPRSPYPKLEPVSIWEGSKLNEKLNLLRMGARCGRGEFGSVPTLLSEDKDIG